MTESMQYRDTHFCSFTIELFHSFKIAKDDRISQISVRKRFSVLNHENFPDYWQFI